MTQAQEIVKYGYRESNLLAIGQSPTSDQETEGLFHLNRIIEAAIGFNVGEYLDPWPIGSNNVDAPPGYPIEINYPWEWLPLNIRVMANLEGAKTEHLHPEPQDGSRLAVVDVSNNFNTYNLTLDGNGRRIDGNTSLTLSTDGFSGEWLYRDDLGEWKKCTDLAAADDLPFPKEFDDYFIIGLAIRLNPKYGQQMSRESAVAYDRADNGLRARYYQTVTTPADPGVLGMSRQSYRGTYWRRGNTDPIRRFKSGLPW